MIALVGRVLQIAIAASVIVAAVQSFHVDQLRDELAGKILEAL